MNARFSPSGEPSGRTCRGATGQHYDEPAEREFRMPRRPRSLISTGMVIAIAVVSPLLLPGTASGAGSAAAGQPTHNAAGNPDLYTLPGQEPGPSNPAGSKYEGIGLDERRNLFYV